MTVVEAMVEVDHGHDQGMIEGVVSIICFVWSSREWSRLRDHALDAKPPGHHTCKRRREEEFWLPKAIMALIIAVMR